MSILHPFTHIYRYGQSTLDGQQRWFFRFGIPHLVPASKPGRPASACQAHCPERSTDDHTSTFFWSPEEAALECDVWKLTLMRLYGVNGLTFSHKSYDNFDSACRYKYEQPAEEWIKNTQKQSLELKRFLQTYSEILLQHQSCADSTAWDPIILLNGAHKELADIEAGAPGDVNLAEARKIWAATWKDHCDLLNAVKDYGLSKIEYELRVKVDSLTKLWNAVAHFKRPEGFVHRKFIVWMESIEADREKLKKLLEDYKASQKLFAGFKDELTKTTEELKKSRP